MDNLDKNRVDQHVSTEYTEQDRLIYGVGTSKLDWQNWAYLKHMPKLDLEKIFPAHKRVVIISPHPDDEILGCAGLIQQLDALDRQIILFAVTDGTGSHPDSTLYTPKQLGDTRTQETFAALKTLQLQQNIERVALNIPDGAVTAHCAELYTAFEHLLHKDDILICTFEKDGHPDHEASAQVTRQFAQDHDLVCLRVLIWAWHWAKPNEAQIPWQYATQFLLTRQQLQRKRQAITCFKSQSEPDPSTGQPPILSATTIERLLQPQEVYMYGE